MLNLKGSITRGFLYLYLYLYKTIAFLTHKSSDGNVLD